MSDEALNRADMAHDQNGRYDQHDQQAWNALMHGMLDGTLNDAERERFGAIIAADEERAREFARAALLHDAMEREFSAAPIGRRTARNVMWMQRAQRLAVAAVLMIAVGTLAYIGMRGSPANAAYVELARISAAAPAGMRTYVIRAIAGDGRVHSKDGRRADPSVARGAGPQSGRGTGRPQPSIDDAVLNLGAAGCYVLTRTGDDGKSIVTGSDGHYSWSIPDRGAVRVSSDLARFRGALPGEQHDLPFIDPKDGLDVLMRSYDIALGAAGEIDGRPVRLIVATRKADVARGPKGVELWYDSETAIIVRMQLDRLPQAQGGPRAVTLDLLAESPLDPAFFTHELHHDADRQVINED